MRAYLIFAAICLTFALWAGSDGFRAEAASPHLVITQVQTSGGSANDEFVEIFNRGAQPVDLNGFRVVYRSAAGSGDVPVPFAEWTTTTIIPPGGYYLIASTSYDGPATPDLTYNPSTCQCSMGAAGGGLAIRQGPNNTGVIIDSVGWGTATNAFVETAVTSAPAANNSQSRKLNGCQDTDNNANDFQPLAPAAPRNTSTPASPCSGSGETLFAAMSLTPNAVSPGGTLLITTAVIPATTPASTGITVTTDLSAIGLSASQTLYDDGTHGDVTAGDNVFSYAASIPTTLAGGTRTITGQARDAQGRVVNLTQSVIINAPLPGEDPLILGNPSNATADIANENNYLMQKPQYTLSYNRQKATPNWSAWHLDSSWIGSTPRQDDFRPDTSLPAGWYQVTDFDYSGSGYDRGHMVPSGDRTNSVANNSATFLMTNMVPQLGANNQGPWEELESYCRTLVQQGNELYIFAGPLGSAGTIAGGKITVPAYTWKVVVVLPNGSDDLQRVRKGTRTIAVLIPNQPPLDVNAPWRNFRTSVNAIEALTGFNFFSEVPINSQEVIERGRDYQ